MTNRAAGLVALAVALAAPAGARRKLGAADLEPVSTGNATGPYAVAVDGGGRLMLAWVASEGEGPARLLWRTEIGPATWGPPEVVLAAAPASVRLAATAFGPAVGFVRDGEAALALRSEGGWQALSLVGAAERATAIALSVEGDSLRALAAADGSGELPAPFVRRVVLREGRIESSSALALPDPRGGSVAALGAAPAGNGWDALLLERRLPRGRIVVIGSDGAADPEFRALTTTRIRDAIPAAALVPLQGTLLDAALAAGETGAAIVWSERQGENVQVGFQLTRAASFRSAEPLLQGERDVAALAVAARGPLLAVGVIAGVAPHLRLAVRWHDGALWGEWHAPPGATAARALDPVGLEMVIDLQNRAHLFVLERWRTEGGGMRIVDWVDLPAMAMQLPR